MKLVVGLGNPGRRYAGTPHNAGFDVVSLLAERLGCGLRRSAHAQALTARGRVDGDWVLLVQPQTFMNASGEAVAALLRYHKADAGELLVVLDDADLPLGRLRVRPAGSSGGHRGLASIAACVGRQDFARVRVGIGRADRAGGLVDYVLSRLPAAERETLKAAVGRAADAVMSCLTDSVEAAMNRFNGKEEASGGLTNGGERE